MDKIKTLKNLGLTEYEAQISLTLLKIGKSKASEISKNCAVPKNKIYDSLETLSKKGIVQIVPSSPKKYFIQNIQTLNILLQNKKEELENLKQDFEKLKKLEKQNNLSSTNEPISIINGKEALLSKLKQEASNLSKECLIVSKGTQANPTLIRLTEYAIKKGVKTRILFPKTDTNKIAEWKTIGAKIKYLEKSPELSFSIFDNKICRLNININNDSNDPTLWIENKNFLNLLKEKFEILWKQAKNK